MPFIKKALLAATAILAAAAVPAKEFTILIYETPVELAKRASAASDGKAYWDGYNQFAGALAQAGVLRGGASLSETETLLARGTAGTDKGMEGARLGGYFVIEAESMDAARRWALLAPVSAPAVEIRPHRANPTMPTAAMAAGK